MAIRGEDPESLPEIIVILVLLLIIMPVLAAAQKKPGTALRENRIPLGAAATTISVLLSRALTLNLGHGGISVMPLPGG